MVPYLLALSLVSKDHGKRYASSFETNSLIPSLAQSYILLYGSSYPSTCNGPNKARGYGQDNLLYADGKPQ